MQQNTAGAELSFLYVANDVIQKTRKDGNFTFEFGKVMAQSIALAAKRNPRAAAKLRRLCSIWLQRAIFPKTFVRKLEATIVKYKDRGTSSPRKRRRPVDAPAAKPKPKYTPVSKLPSLNIPQQPMHPGGYAEEFGGELPSLLRDLSEARASIESGKDVLGDLEPIIAEGRLPPEAVERLSELTSTEYNGLMGQVGDALDALKKVTSHSKRADQLNSPTLAAIAALLLEQEKSIADTRLKMQQQQDLVDRVAAIQLAHGGEKIVTRARPVKSPEPMLARSASIEEDMALEPLELDINTGGTDGAAAATPTFGTAADLKGETESMPPGDEKGEPKKDMVWDALRRDYVPRRSMDDEEDWRN